MLTSPNSYDTLLTDDRRAIFLSVNLAQSRFGKLNRLPIINRNAPFYLEDRMPVGVYKRKITPAIRRANRNRMLGRHRSGETKEKIRKGLWREKSSNWKGGTMTEKGYMLIRSENHPYATRNGHYVCEHRLVMEKMIGRYLTPNEEIHHLNGIRDDNREENLLLCTRSQHRIIEAKMVRLAYRLIQEGKIAYNKEKENFEFTSALTEMRERIGKL